MNLQAREVGPGILTITGWGHIEVSIIEAERLSPVPDELQPEQVLQTAMVTLFLSIAGLHIRDINRRNWGTGSWGLGQKV